MPRKNAADAVAVAPLVVPMIDGEARALRKSPWLKTPAAARRAPQRAEDKTLGSLISKIMVLATLDVSELKRASRASKPVTPLPPIEMLISKLVMRKSMLKKPINLSVGRV